MLFFPGVRAGVGLRVGVVLFVEAGVDGVVFLRRLV